MNRALPSQPWEIILLAVSLLVFLLVVYAVLRVRRRGTLVGAASGANEDAPRLQTQQRVTGTVRRRRYDPAQEAWLVTADVGVMRLTFRATDYAESDARYRGLLGKPADIALFALATLERGGAEAMRHQIKDADKIDLRPDLVTLTPAGQFANDYAVIGRVLDSREDTWDDLPLVVYRTQVVRSDDRTLVLDLAVQQSGGAARFAPQTMVHGSARLFGYLNDPGETA